MAGEASAPGIRAGTPAASSFVKDKLPRDPRRAVTVMNLVHAGTRSGPALARIQGATELESAVGRVVKLAQQRDDAVRAVVGGSYMDRATRSTVRVVPDPMLSPEGRERQANLLTTNAVSAANGVLQKATEDLNTVLAQHPSVPPLGVDPQVPGNRAGELQTLIALALSGTYDQWRGLMQSALDGNDVVKAVSYTHLTLPTICSV